MSVCFWDRVKHGASELDLNLATVSTWKHRGRVPGAKQISIFQVLQGTEYEISLEEFKLDTPIGVGASKNNEET